MRTLDILADALKNYIADLADLEWHTITTDELVQRLNTSLKDGLSDDQVRDRLQRYGKNAPSPPKTHRLKTILGYLFKGFGSILLVAAVLVFVAWRPLGDPPAQANLALAIVLLAVFFIQAAFNMWQDWSSGRVMASIKDMLPDECLVLRDGVQMTLFASDLVPGDVLLMKAGNKLPADIRIVQASSDVKFDRSILTGTFWTWRRPPAAPIPLEMCRSTYDVSLGESVPLNATVDSTDSNYLETKNIGLQGTHCVSGTCTGVVVATGNRTVFGRIATLTNQPKTGMTTLEREILNFVLIICSIMFIMIVLVLILWSVCF